MITYLRNYKVINPVTRTFKSRPMANVNRRGKRIASQNIHQLGMKWSWLSFSRNLNPFSSNESCWELLTKCQINLVASSYLAGVVDEQMTFYTLQSQDWEHISVHKCCSYYNEFKFSMTTTIQFYTT